MMNSGRSQFHQIPHGLPVADIDGEVTVARQGRYQLGDDGLRSALLAEELAAHVVVGADHIPALFVQEPDTLRTDQATGSGDKGRHRASL